MAAGLLCQKTGPRFPRLQHHDTTRIRISVVVTVAPAGPIATKADNPNLPTQPADIAAAGKAAHELSHPGAHTHPPHPRVRSHAHPRIRPPHAAPTAHR